MSRLFSRSVSSASPLLLHLLLGVSLFCVSPAVASSAYPSYRSYAGKPYRVSYDQRSIRLNDEPVTFLSGSIHYPRSTPGMWPSLMQQAALDGVNMIELYVFWNYHEMVEGQYDWTGRGNLTLFLDAIADAGLFANLRIGPYVCAEWDYGGIPTWLAYKEGMHFRSYNDHWRAAVQHWVGIVIDQTRNYFADRGGPIVLAQIENELGGGDMRYVQWNGDMANALNVNVPWIMCNGASANNTINTCNGNDCAGFLENNGQSGRILIDQPAMWTENEGWFEGWGDDTSPEGQHSDRTPEDVAYTVVRWFARGGSHMNYYMYHGGNHYDRTAAGGLPNMYANGVNFHSDGLPNEPKKTHLQTMHFALANVSDELVAHPVQYKNKVALQWRYNASEPWSSGTDQVAFMYGSVVFIESNAPRFVQTWYENVVYDLPAQTILIMRSGELVFNSSDVKLVDVERVNKPVVDRSLIWQVWTESVFSAAATTTSALNAGIPVFHFPRPVEQLNLTQDLTEYCWYSTTVNVAESMGSVNLTIESGTAQSFVVYMDGHYIGSCYDQTKSWPFTGNWECRVMVSKVAAGQHQLSLMSIALGIENGMGEDEVGYEHHFKGIRGRVKLGSLDVTESDWAIRPYLTGEYLDLASSEGHGAVSWSDDWKSAVAMPLTWFYATFPEVQLPSGLFSVLLDMRGMGRGHAYVNGHDIGRYWLIEGGNSGYPTQWLYHVPQDWLVQGANNSLTIIEELGSVDPTQLRVVVSQLLPSKKQLTVQQPAVAMA